MNTAWLIFKFRRDWLFYMILPSFKDMMLKFITSFLEIVFFKKHLSETKLSSLSGGPLA